METQCFFLPLEFISPDIFLGIALSTVMFICEKHFIKDCAEDYDGMVRGGGMGAMDS